MKWNCMSKQSGTKKVGLKIKASTLDQIFDEGDDILQYADVHAARLVKPKIQRINVDLPQWVVAALDNASTRRGIARQALVKTWLVECLESESQRLVKSKRKPA